MLAIFTAQTAGRLDESLSRLRDYMGHRERRLQAQLLTGGDDERAMAVREVRAVSDWSVATALQTEHPAFATLAAELSLESQGRTLDALKQSQSWLRQEGNEKSRKTMRTLRAHQKSLAQWSRRRKRTPRRAQREMRQLAERISAAEEELAALYQASFPPRAPVTLARTRDAIPLGSTLLAYVTYAPGGPALFTKYAPQKSAQTGRRIALLIVDPRTPLRWHDLGPEAELSKRLSAFRTHLAKRAAGDGASGQRLRELLIPDTILNSLSGQRLLVLPTGRINLVPFAALPIGNGTRLAASHSIHYLSSPRDLLAPPPAVSGAGPLLMANPDFGDQPGDDGQMLSLTTRTGTNGFGPLAGTAREANAIQRALGLSADRVLTGKRHPSRPYTS